MSQTHEARAVAVLSLLAIAVGPPACRRASSSGPSTASASASVSASAPPVAASAPFRLEAPFAAALVAGRVHVAGVKRGEKAIAVASIGAEGSATDVTEIPLEESADAKLEDVDLVASDRALTVVVSDTSGTRARRGTSEAALAGAPWESIDAAWCATKTSLISLGRADGGVASTMRDLVSDAGAPPQLVPSKSSPSLLCTSSSAFVFRDDGARRLATRLGGDAAEVVLATDVGRGEEQTIAQQPDDHGIVVTRVGSLHGFSFRSWSGGADAPTPWSTPWKMPDDATLELVIAGPEDVVLVVSRPVAPARPCKNGEDSDVVAEITVLSRATGKPSREHDRVERWSCGADAGPFFGGVAGQKLVVAWPRGADASCAKLGARFGGLAHATIARDAAPRVERHDAPAEAIEDAGCDGERCAVVVLSRAYASGCVDGSAPAAGQPRALFYP